MGRWHQFCFLAAALGSSGCLLFSDPVNKAPTVSITPNGTVISRGQPVDFFATVSDDHDPPSAIQLRWHEFQADSCVSITPASWPSDIDPLHVDQPYTLKAKTVAPICLCVQATDTHGARGYACYGDGPIKPTNPKPTAVITDDSGVLSGQDRALCSQIRLSADKRSNYPSDDPLDFKWGGTDPTGTDIQLTPCDNVVGNKNAHRCLSASAEGTYTVSLTIRDLATDPPAESDTAQFVIHVKPDSPPCIGRSDPDRYAKWVVLSSGADVSSSFRSRTFKAINVADDCEPYPTVSGSTGQAQFVWSVFDPTTSTDWASQTNSGESFTVSQAQFPNARPGDTIKVRLEVRDTLVQQSYHAGIPACADKSLDICCGPAGCSGINDCVRWTTWTVQFQP